MRTLGNILWFVFGGFFSGLAWIFSGVMWCITLIGIPLAAGAFIGIRLSGRPALLTAVIAAAFVICIFLFFYLYRSLYMQPAATLRDRSLAFAETYGLSSRETQMLEMIVEGSSNKDIAAKLFISENTVKFHIRNLLKKTGCSNRSGLISLFNSK